MKGKKQTETDHDEIQKMNCSGNSDVIITIKVETVKQQDKCALTDIGSVVIFSVVYFLQ